MSGVSEAKDLLRRVLGGDFGRPLDVFGKMVTRMLRADGFLTMDFHGDDGLRIWKTRDKQGRPTIVLISVRRIEAVDILRMVATGGPAGAARGVAVSAVGFGSGCQEARISVPSVVKLWSVERLLAEMSGHMALFVNLEKEWEESRFSYACGMLGGPPYDICPY